MSDAGDVRLQLNDLEAEEARIMRELREMDEKAHAESEANKRRAEQYKEDPEAALTSLLLECEKEVRDAKGYIADQGPPLRIVRLRHGETGPKSATYLSRPRNTGVDFTVPVTLKAYTDLIKRPIFLNQIRDKIKHHKYSSTTEYLDDVRLLVKNTVQFNKGPDLAWVVQHARFLLEAAEDAVSSRRLLFHEVEEALRQRNTQKLARQNTSSLSAVGKRKRPHAQDKTNGDISAVPAVGSAIEIYWPSYRKWYLAYITAHGEDGSCHLRYDEDNSLQWVTLDHERWRMRNSRFTGAARGKRSHEQPAKRRKGAAAAAAVQPTEQPVYVPGGITPEDLDAIKIDLFAKFDDLRDSIMEHLKDHIARMDRAIIRSDALSRILIQVEDTEANMHIAMKNMEKKFDGLEKKVEESLKTHGPHQADTGPTPEPEKNVDRSQGQNPDEDSAGRVGSDKLVQGSQSGSARDHVERETALTGPADDDKSAGSQPQKGIFTAGADRDEEGGNLVSHPDAVGKVGADRDEEGGNVVSHPGAVGKVGADRDEEDGNVVSHPGAVGKVGADRDEEDGNVVSHPDAEGKAIDEKEKRSDPTAEQSAVKSAIEKSPEEKKGPGKVLESNQEPETSKVDVEMIDVADEEKRRRPDGSSSPKKDKPADHHADTKAHTPRRNRPIHEDPIDLEAVKTEEATKQKEQEEESSDSNQSDGSESDDSDVHKRVAEKKPATRPPPEAGSKVELKPQNSEEQEKELPDDEAPARESAEVEMKDNTDDKVDPEREKQDTEVSMEKPSEEMEIAAPSATGSDAKEDEKDNGLSSREPKVVEGDVGD